MRAAGPVLTVIGMRTALVVAIALAALTATASAEPELVGWEEIESKPAGRETKQEPRWTQLDTAIETVVAVTFFADYLQTRQIIADGPCMPTASVCRGDGESNPVIRAVGAGPYFAGVAIVHAAAMYALPPRLRHIAQGVTIGVELAVINHNLSAGYAITF